MPVLNEVSFICGGHFNETTLHADIKRARRIRELRKRLFGKAIYSGPAWSVLLHLFECYASQITETIGAVGIGADLPDTTCWRWIHKLDELALLRIYGDVLDDRRRFVELSSRGIDLMTRYFSGASPHLIAA